MNHFGDPCRHCGTPHDEVKPGRCSGDPAKAIPIAYCLHSKRWDGYDCFLIRLSDGTIRQRWHHPSERAPYYHFGYWTRLTHPPAYDPNLSKGLKL